MDKFLAIYQHLPERIDPNISFGFFSVSWYSLMYLVAFGVVYFLVKYRIKKGEYGGIETANLILDFLLYAFVGLIIGARLGEVLFYNFSYYMADPIRIISPFDPVTHEFVGLYGMSYHGGLVGAILATWLWTRKNNIYPVEYAAKRRPPKAVFNRVKLLAWVNFIVPAVPLGYFFGRVGNFLNGELYGRPTDSFLGMYFPTDIMKELRHPSQLYEAFLEGIVLFAILWPIRNKNWARKNMLAFYLFGYAAARIIAEFFREPDGYIGFLTLGQFYSFFMIFASILVFLYTKKSDIIKEEKK